MLASSSRAHVSPAELAFKPGGSLVSYVVRATPQEHLEWGVNRVGCVPTADMRGIECVDERTGRILGMVLYTNWAAGSVQMHVAIDSPMAVRRLVGPAFRYPFEECGRQVVVGLVAANNEKAISFDTHLGFKEVARIKDGWDVGVDFILFQMRKDDWLKQKHKRAA